MNIMSSKKIKKSLLSFAWKTNNHVSCFVFQVSIFSINYVCPKYLWIFRNIFGRSYTLGFPRKWIKNMKQCKSRNWEHAKNHPKIIKIHILHKIKGIYISCCFCTWHKWSYFLDKLLLAIPRSCGIR